MPRRIQFDRYTLLIVIRVILIIASCLVFAFIFSRSDFLFSQLILLSVIVLQAIELSWFSRRLIRELQKFLMAVRYGDVTVSFHMESLGRDFGSLAGSFRDLIGSMQEMRGETEAQFQVLQIVIDRISAGIIVYETGGSIILMNSSAAELLNTGKVPGWQFLRDMVPDFSAGVESLDGPGRKLIELREGGEEKQLSVVVHLLTIRGVACRLITFYDIRNEIEQKEIEAWYKLIRVLTHEIMNSVTPLGSLTDTILMLLEENGRQKSMEKITEQQITDIRHSVQTIQKRSDGILRFVEDYRKLTRIPNPEIEKISVSDMFDRVSLLLGSMLEENQIELVREIVPENLFLLADPVLMDQVMINLITNAVYACRDSRQPVIELKAWKEKNSPRIEVADNGKGITPDKMSRIFIPFYSTREGGSGIGLSFSKHVINLHKSRIKVQSEPGIRTSFVIEFPRVDLQGF